jgi:hypothetical protein
MTPATRRRRGYGRGRVTVTVEALRHAARVLAAEYQPRTRWHLHPNVTAEQARAAGLDVQPCACGQTEDEAILNGCPLAARPQGVVEWKGARPLPARQNGA